MLNSFFTYFEARKDRDTSRIILWTVTLTLLIFFLISAKSYWVYQNYQSELQIQIEQHLSGLAIDREVMTRMIIDKHKSDLQLLAQKEVVKNFELNPRSNTKLLADLLNNNPSYSGWVLTNVTAGRALTGGRFPNDLWIGCYR